MDEQIKAIKETAERLVNLLNDPHPGLSMWCGCVGDLLIELAKYAPEKKK